MPQSLKLSKPSHGGKESENSYTASSNLWVGNLAAEVTDSDLMDLFAKFGALDSITAYSSRSFAFVYFKRVEDAKVAKETLQGTSLRGSLIKIEFARPAKPSKRLWVGGISISVTKEILEEEFLKYGKIEDFKFSRDRNTAFIDYFRMEDASQAMKNMNGRRLGGDQIRVDFVRSQPFRRDQWPEVHDPRDGHLYSWGVGQPDSPWMSQNSGRNYLDPKRQMPSQSSGGRKGDGQPSNVLWVGYPPSVQIDEQMLHNAMILFGEIERIKSFPSRHYSFVEFRSVEEARRAKEGLQGRLFNDPRIAIMFSSSGLAPGKDYPAFYPGVKGPRPDMFAGELPFRPSQMEHFSHNRPTVPNTFHGTLQPSGMLGTNLLTRPFASQGGFDPVLSTPDFTDLAKSSSMLGPNWRRPSPPTSGILSVPSSIRPTVRSKSSAWDVLDANQVQRESKRSRMDVSTPIDDTSYPLRKLDDQGFGLDRSDALGPLLDSGPSFQGNNHFSPLDTRVVSGGSAWGHPDNDYIWRGIIAKGGTPVCHARCVPIGKGLEAELSEVVNCSARTGLEMLTKHYFDAVGFDIVFFLPDSEEDFASYTEFLRYLGAKNRAGVAKLDDGTTLFLVPPSEFLTKVLNVSGPERLYGVVLKLPQISDSAPIQQQSHHSTISSQYVGRQHGTPSQPEYNVVPHEEQTLQVDYGRSLPLESKTAANPVHPPTTETPTMQSVPHDYSLGNAAAASQSRVSLTPELIATLATLLPANTQSSEAGHQPAVSSIAQPFAVSGAPDKGLPQGWKQEYEAPVQAGHSSQLGSQFNSHSSLPLQYQAYPTATGAPSQTAHGIHGSAQIQDPAFSIPQSGIVPSRPLHNSVGSSQSGQFTVLPQVNHQYQIENSHNSQMGFGMQRGTEAVGYYALPQQPKNAATANQVQGNFSQAQGAMPMSVPIENLELPNQGQQVRAGQGTAEVEEDKNQRYQSTLRFAANLLLQIQQQQQQQPPPQGGSGSGN